MKIQITYKKRDPELGEKKGSISFTKIDENATDEQIIKLANAVISLADTQKINTFYVYKITTEEIDRTISK